ncbi:MAG TPA: hypothetical protein VHW67_13250 [Solirubrobacteraceae bacterium]|jgi:hypothetical protein|nr:hypothetical protein [Solirubrobacteraceae bacterium]
MRSVRFSFLALLVGVIVAVVVPAAAQAAVEVEKFVGINCKATAEAEKCGEEEVGTDPFGSPIAETVEPDLPTSKEQGYTQAAGHVPFGVTDFTVAHSGKLSDGSAIPSGVVTHVRVDVAAGLATAPAAVPQCSLDEFGSKEVFEGTGLGFYTEPTCKTAGGPHGTGAGSTVIGEETATVYVAGLGDVTIAGTLYNLIQPEPPTARASFFGAALELPKPLTEIILGKFAAIPAGEAPGEKGAQYYAHTLVEGNVEWGQEAKGTGAGDYHDYFEVSVSPELPLIRSRQEDYGTVGNGAFITNGTSCPGDNTTFLTLEGVPIGTEQEIKEHLESGVREKARRPYKTLLGLNGCGLMPFDPTFGLSAGDNESGFDAPDGIVTSVGLTRHPEDEVDSAQLKTAAAKLPPGMTLNPSAAAGLTACTPAQARIHSDVAGTDCPASSAIGTVDLDVPTLPDGSLTGNIYLGAPDSGTITGPPYVIYVDAESPRYDVSARLKGETSPDLATGQLTTVFSENPEQPFTNIQLHFKGGALAPIANSLTCDTGAAEGSFQPFATELAARTLNASFASTGCPSTIPFAPSQATANQTGNAGGNTSYTFSLTRPEGHQYLGAVKTTLPAGLVGQIPKATQCTEAQANAEPSQCPDSSQIGVAAAISGAGPTPYTFGNGKVFLTGPYQGAPFGLLIEVPAVAGPFNLGEVKTRAKIDIDPFTARVTTTATIPTIVKGIPIRLRGVTVSINKQGFLLNPTSCAAMATETTVTSTFGASQNLSTPFQLANCNLLKFKPTFKAVTTSKTSKANGASLETTLNEVPGNANVKSVKVQLPKALPSRLTTLQKACPAATFEANYHNCPAGSFVGGARANTPTLPGKLQGPAILVSHAAEAFPDLDLVMEANGVRSVLVGNTDIKKGITTTTFASTPDVPVSSITVNLPIGAHSALAANGNLCANPLVMPTTMTGQNGTVVKQNTTIKVNTCGVRVVGHKVVGNTARVTVRTFAPGRVSGSGAGLATKYRKLSKAQKKVTIQVPLSRKARGKHRPFKVKLRVGFVPKAKGQRSSASFVTVTF